MAFYYRSEIRRMVGNLLGDVTWLQATATGTTTTFVDTIRLSSNIESPFNRDLVYTAQNAALIGTVRRVTGADLLAGWISFDAMSAASTLGDTVELYNFRGKGWRIDEYNSAINQAIREAANNLYREPVTYPVEVDDIESDNIHLSANYSELTHIVSIEAFNSGTLWNTIKPASKQNGYGWWADGGQNISIEGYSSTLSGAGAGDLYIKGFKAPTELGVDTAETYIPVEWLSLKTAEILCASALDRDQGNFARAQMFARKADMALPSIRTRIPGSTRRVTPVS